ncbi:helix-turn-helix domain-containing protein [Tsukamurella spumae]|uniref:Helix-turn-helix transcriptional regulator n=1 Tax=Tsukamurella spumae TaxID=44753 RepID=A0A846X4K9_9ACTN|nr:helix-turn-helix domain-containing protein [Tsukamurella spumae]NKY19505.1 helix-turn-helix transcriptional regulator [Tsukamurella spumae]
MTFADKLNDLFESRPDPARGVPYTTAAVAQGVSAAGGRLSAPYLSQLRTGRKAKVSVDVVVGLAKWFNVPVDYFVEDEGYAQMIRESSGPALNAVSDSGAVEIAYRSAQLSPEARARVLALTEKLRAAEERGSATTDSD